MIQIIHKFEIPAALWSETSLESAIQMPKGAELLHVAEQDGRLMLWALVDRNAPPCGRHIVVLLSDQAVEWPKPAKHVGTVPHFHGWMVFHVFDLGEVELAPRPVA